MRSFITVVLFLNVISELAWASEADRTVEPHPGWANALKPQGVPGPELTLTSGSRTLYRIVVPNSATSQEIKAATDLQHWLKKMTSAEFLIAAEGDSFVATGREISVGRTVLLAQADIPQKDADLGDEGYAIGVVGERLFVFGGKRRGPIYGVYALLEEDLGCRWYARHTATIPKRTDLTFAPVPRTHVPPLVRRLPWYSDAHDGAWSLRNRTSSHGSPVPVEWGGYPQCANWFVHSYNSLLPPSRYFAEHPEYYSELDGVRRDRQLCPTNPDVIRLVTAEVLRRLEACPSCQYVDVSPNDWRDYCECSRCKTLDDAEGSKAASLLTLVNAVADGVAEVRPDVRVTTLAYLGTYFPPKTIRPRDNVEIVLCTDSHAWEFPLLSIDETERFMSALTLWSDHGANLMIWDYPVVFHRYMRPLPNLKVIERNMRLFVEHGACGIIEQSCHSGNLGIGRAQLRSWLWAKQMWDISRDTDPLVRDFYFGFYGKAAEPLYEYDQMLAKAWDRAHAEWKRRHPEAVTPDIKEYEEVFFDEAFFFPLEFIEKADGLFKKAIQLADGDTELTRRIEYARLSILAARAEEGPGEDRQAYLVMLNEFERIARREGAVYVLDAFSGPDLDRCLKLWRSVAMIDPAKVHSQPFSHAWKFRPDPEKKGIEGAWFATALDDSSWGTVRSDLGHKGWESQGYAEYEVGYGWYRQTFDVPANLAELENLRMFFGAIDEQADIWINGTKVLSHTTEVLGMSKDFLWKTPFHFDPKPYLQAGQSNQLTVRVHNTLHVGGIWKPVYLTWGQPVEDLYGLCEYLRLTSRKEPGVK